MIVVQEPSDLRSVLDDARAAGKSVGFQPTMGALHGGHMANIGQMAAECDFASISIFVNPLQFGPGEDFAAYPRDLGADVDKAEEAGADLVFAPPGTFAGPQLTRVSVAGLEDILEGAERPGHFGGVATIVTKLLSVVGPCFAYFGEKDYQQLVIVRRLVEDLSLRAVVVGCPTVRETDGLALSSRNSYLGPEDRQAAPRLYWSLLAGKRAIEEDGVSTAADVEAAMQAVAAGSPRVHLSYAAVVDPVTLERVSDIDGEVRLLVAGRVGPARLIDNVGAAPGEG